MALEILISPGNWPPKRWVAGLSKSEIVSKVHVWPTSENLDQVEVLLVWKPLPEGVIERLPKLRFISSMGAGVDHLLGDPQILNDIPVARIVDGRLKGDMTNFVLMAVVMHQRGMLNILENQKNRHWERHHYPNLKIGILGMGELGSHLAKQLIQSGFEVSGYSKSGKEIDHVMSFQGDQLDEFLAEADVLVNLLPVTKHTQGILNMALFQKVKKGCYLINVARGAHLVEEDLINALDRELLSGALLDVFREEPLPSSHPFWQHPKITITPHIASVTTPESAIKLVLENCQRLLDGKELLHLVDLKRGY